MISSIINELLFDYSSLDEENLIKKCSTLSNKVLRWLGENHPDNKTRKLFFKLTGVIIGNDSVINKNFVISDDYKPLLTIGERVAISPNVTIICASAPNNSILTHHPYVQSHLIVSKPVVIGNDSWLGTGAIILPGTTIGKSCVVGAGAIVSRDVPDHSIVIGAPARVIKKLDQIN